MDFKRFREIQAQNATLCERKNKAYGDKNLTRFGMTGIIVRMTDKMERLINMVHKNHIDEETVFETAGDMANYAVILQQMATKSFDEEVMHAVGPDSGRVRRRGGRRAKGRRPRA